MRRPWRSSRATSDRVIRMWNPAAERMFGWTEEEVLNTATSIVPDAPARRTQRTTRARRRRARRSSSRRRSACTATGTLDRRVDVDRADLRRRRRGERHHGDDRRHHAAQAGRGGAARERGAACASRWTPRRWACGTGSAIPTASTYSEGLSTCSSAAPPRRPLVDYRDLQRCAAPRRPRALRCDAAPRRAARATTSARLPRGLARRLGALDRQPRPGASRFRRARACAWSAWRWTSPTASSPSSASRTWRTTTRSPGLPNRVLLRDRIQQAIAQAHRNGTQLAVLFIDLDRFKTINDSLGHQLGDRLLQSVASRILVCVREGDTVSRVGGDEFVIVIPGIGAASDASRVAAKILEVLASVVPPARQRPARGGLHRHQPLPGRRRRRRDADAQRRHGDVPREGLGPRQLPVLHPAHERGGAAAPARSRIRCAARSSAASSSCTTSRSTTSRDRIDHRVRGAAALESARGGDGARPREFIPVAEESGLIVPDRRMGAARSAAAGAQSWQSPGRAAARSPSTSRRSSYRAASFVERLRRLVHEIGHRPAAGRARGDRERDHRGRGRSARGPRPAGRAGRGHRDRRLRHRATRASPT